MKKRSSFNDTHTIPFLGKTGGVHVPYRGRMGPPTRLLLHVVGFASPDGAPLRKIKPCVPPAPGVKNARGAECAFASHPDRDAHIISDREK